MNPSRCIQTVREHLNFIPCLLVLVSHDRPALWRVILVFFTLKIAGEVAESWADEACSVELEVRCASCPTKRLHEKKEKRSPTKHSTQKLILRRKYQTKKRTRWKPIFKEGRHIDENIWQRLGKPTRRTSMEKKSAGIGRCRKGVLRVDSRSGRKNISSQFQELELWENVGFLIYAQRQSKAKDIGR